jgi:hypothetical protein
MAHRLPEPTLEAFGLTTEDYEQAGRTDRKLRGVKRIPGILVRLWFGYFLALALASSGRTEGISLSQILSSPLLSTLCVIFLVLSLLVVLTVPMNIYNHIAHFRRLAGSERIRKAAAYDTALESYKREAEEIGYPKGS